MRTEHAAVAVYLVDDDVAQVLEELRPFRVMRQHALMQHVGVADDDVAVQPYRLARIAGGVAVEGERAQAEIASAVEFEQLRHLVLGERLGRKQIQRLRA